MLKRISVLVLILICFFACIANAQTLKNSKYGFSFKLPDKWDISQKDPSSYILSDKKKQGEIIVSISPYFSEGRLQGEEQLILEGCIKHHIEQISSLGANIVVESTVKEKIAGQYAITVTYFYSTPSNETLKSRISYFWMNGRVLVIGYRASPEKFETLLPIFNNTVNSFQLDNPTSTDLTNQGYLHLSKEAYDKAAKAFIESSNLDPNNSSNYYSLAYIHLQHKNYDKTIEEINKAIVLKPDLPIYYKMRAIAYAHLKKFDLAMTDANKIIELYPDYGGAYSVRGNIYALMGKYHEALLEFQKCHALMGHPLDSTFNLAQCYELLGDKDLALANYKEISEIPDLSLEVKQKVDARLNGDWDSCKEWV